LAAAASLNPNKRRSNFKTREKIKRIKMDILKLLLGNSSGMLDAMSQKSGLGTNDVEAVISKIAPIFMQRANENFKSDADSSNFLEMIRRSNLGEMTGTPQNISVAEGNELLGVLTGSKENSRALASDVVSQLGISADSIKTLLPMIAPMIAGMLNNQLKASNLQDSADSGSMMSMLTQFLDQNKDGSIVDDIFRIAGDFFGKK